MIRNVVFDLGNVLLSFKPAEYLDQKNYPKHLKNKILADIFNSVSWQQLDRGEISTEEAVEIIAKTSTLEREEIARIFELRFDVMFPLENNIKMLPELKKRGYRLYYLSNFPIDLFLQVNSLYSFFETFDGGVISSIAKSNKPEDKIYRYFLEKYTLNPEECVFFDDLEVNVLGAKKNGINAVNTNGSSDFSTALFKMLDLYKYTY
jgi:glucose-1-phosphatase